MNKIEIRKTLLDRRRRLSEDFIRTASRKIAKNLVNSNILENVSDVLIYLPINGEVDTLEIFNVLHKRQINTFVPTFVDGAWLISKYEMGDKLENIFRNVPQPKNIVNVDTATLDLIVMPGVAFDISGVRLGMGLAVYDKLLLTLRITKVGLAYEFQIVDQIESEPHDVSVDYVVTEKRVLKPI